LAFYAKYACKLEKLKIIELNISGLGEGIENKFWLCFLLP
jgi:hypothetical protein